MGGRQQANLTGSGLMETRRVVKLYEPYLLLIPLCGPRLKCAGASALDALVSQRKLCADHWHPTLFP